MPPVSIGLYRQPGVRKREIDDADEAVVVIDRVLKDRRGYSGPFDKAQESPLEDAAGHDSRRVSSVEYSLHRGHPWTTLTASLLETPSQVGERCDTTTK